MERVIYLASTPPLRKAYQRLLTSGWHKRTLEAVLELLWKEIEAAHRLTDTSFREVLNPHRRGLPASGFDRQVIDEIRHFRRHFRSDLIPPVPDDFPNRRGRRQAQAETTWTYLVLDNLARLQGDTGFFADGRSLLFLLAIDFLLPELTEPADAAERACLVNALYMHTFITWTHDPQRQAHHFFLQAVLMDALGKPRLRRDNLRYALNLTDIEDHSFLTKAQAYVFSLLDAGQDEEAKRFLLRLYRHAPETYLAELQEMLDHVQGASSTARG